MEEIKVADTARYVSFYAYDSADHISPADGITGHTVYYFLNNGSSTAMTTPTVTEKDSTNMKGWYTLAVDEAGMVSTKGVVSINIEATGMDPVPIKVQIVSPTTHCSTSGTVNVGSVFSGTHTNTCSDDASHWVIEESGTNIDVELGFGIGTNRVPTSVSCVLSVDFATTGTSTFYAYNYLTSAWDKINYKSLDEPGTSDTAYRFSLLQDHGDTDGSVKIRIVVTGFDAAEVMNIDLVNVQSIDAGSIANGVKLGAQGKLDVNAEADTALSDYGANTTTPPTAAAIVNEWETQSQADPAGFHVNVKEVNGIAQTANDNGADINDILDDTAEIGTAGAGLTDLGGMSSGMQSEVNNQVVDVIRTDTTSEMSQGAPPATPTFEEMVAYLYFKMRNKQETTASEDAIYNNAGDTKLFKSTISDNGTTFTKQEYGSGA